MKRKTMFFSLLLALALVLPRGVLAQGDDYLTYPYKTGLNAEGSVNFYMDEDFRHFVIAGRGKIENLNLKDKIRGFAEIKYEEIEGSTQLSQEEKEKAIDELNEKYFSCLEDFVLEIKSGIHLPDDCTGLFSGISGITYKDVIFPKDLDTSNVTNMSYMFYNQPTLDPDVSNWDTSNVEDMSYMFAYATRANPDVSRWDTSGVKDHGLGVMFNGAKNADPDTRNWVIKNVDFIQNLFWGSNVSEVDMRTWKFKEKADDYDLAAAFHGTKNLQYLYLSADHPFYNNEYEEVLAADFKMQKDGESAGKIMPGSHDKYTFGKTGADTLYFVPQETSLNVVWKDNDNENGFRPDKQKVELIANGAKIESPMTIPQGANPVELNADNDWHHSYSDLDIFSGGKKIDYSVKAEDLDDYITDYYFKKEGTVLSSSQAGKIEDQEEGFTIVNTYMTIAEEKPLGQKPRVPKNFVRVLVDTTDKASPETRYQRAFWVTPNIQVQLPLDQPQGRDGYEFDHWKSLDRPEMIWKKGEKVQGVFKKETKIEARYKTKSRPNISFVSPGREEGVHLGYITGYPDKTIRAEGNITRAEAVTMLVRLKAYPLTEGQGIFKDVEKNSWYAPYIEAAYRQNILEEKAGEGFRPDEKITRGELAQLISHIDKKNTAKAPFTDIRGYKYKKAIDQNYGNKRILGYPDGTFRPEAGITRAETAAMLNRLFDRCVKEEGLKNVEIHEFKDLKDKTYWAYYEIIEASHSHNYVRVHPNTIEEMWKTIIR